MTALFVVVGCLAGLGLAFLATVGARFLYAMWERFLRS
jgi:hypothetical protein